MADPTVSEAIASTLAELGSMLQPEHAALAGRIRRAHDVAAADPQGELADRDVRLLRRITMGTMGGMSDVAFGAIVDGRWVVDEARDQRFHDLSLRLSDQLSRLPPSQPPDLFLVTDRVRQAWLLERDSPGIADRAVEVQPPIWTGPATTSEIVVLRGGSENGADVEVVVEDPASPSAQVDIGHGRVFVTLEDAEAAVPNR
jgi:hypothetical protein